MTTREYYYNGSDPYYKGAAKGLGSTFTGLELLRVWVSKEKSLSVKMGLARLRLQSSGSGHPGVVTWTPTPC